MSQVRGKVKDIVLLLLRKRYEPRYGDARKTLYRESELKRQSRRRTSFNQWLFMTKREEKLQGRSENLANSRSVSEGHRKQRERADQAGIFHA